MQGIHVGMLRCVDQALDTLLQSCVLCKQPTQVSSAVRQGVVDQEDPGENARYQRRWRDFSSKRRS